MSFKGAKFEGPQEKGLIRAEEKREKERAFEGLVGFVEEVAEKLRREGVPVSDDCRIDMRVFGSVHSEDIIEKDLEEIQEREKSRYPGFSIEEIKKEKLKSDGEKLEMLKTVIFTKGLGEDFIVARTSPYDDEKGIDNVILEKETGNVICALDEVADISGGRYEAKMAKVLRKNRQPGKGIDVVDGNNGGRLKYGFKMEKDKDNQSRLTLGQVESIPLFYLALSKEYLEEGIKRASSFSQPLSTYERKLFDYFISSLALQINHLELEPNLSPELKKRVARFGEIIARFTNKKQ